MDFNVDRWLAELLEKLEASFGARLLFLGLQGSYQRGEETPESDIDVVAVLDAVSVVDLKSYREIVDSMPLGYKACGFLSGKEELLHWPKHDLFRLYHDTRPVAGELLPLLPQLERGDVARSVRIDAANLYHAAVHCFLYEELPAPSLTALFKSAFFLMRGYHDLKSGDYVQSKRELAGLLEDEIDREILALSLNHEKLFQLDDKQTEECYQKLIEWSGSILSKVSE